MRAFIQKFSDGKISIKYLLIKPVYSRKRRLLITSLATALIIIIAALLISLYRGKDSALIIISIISFISILLSFILSRLLLRFETVGTIYFNEDHLLIEQAHTSIIPYNKLVRIEYVGNLPENYHVQRYDHNYKTYHVRFITSDKQSIILDITRDLFVLPEDKNQFSEIYPVLTRTLEELNPKYGIRLNKKLRYK